MNNIARNVSQPESSPLVFVNKFLVIDSHKVQNRSMEVVHMNRQLGDIIAEIIGFAKYTWFNAATRHQNGKATRMVVAAVIVFGEFSLAIIGTPEFAAPDN